MDLFALAQGSTTPDWFAGSSGFSVYDFCFKVDFWSWSTQAEDGAARSLSSYDIICSDF